MIIFDSLTEKIINKVTEANLAYRSGNPIMGDQEYDDLLDSLKSKITEDEYENLVSSLNEGSVEPNSDGKVKHPFIMGSMTKIKAEEPDEVKKWIENGISIKMSVSAKVDGISSRATYRNGKLVGLYSRGDGHFGMDYSDKSEFIKGLPSTLSYNFTGEVRGELVIFKSDFEGIKEQYANPRNACAGICNRKMGDKKFNQNELRLISFVPYTILGYQYTKQEQFALLDKLGFNVAKNFTIDKCEIKDDIADVLFKQTIDWTESLGYEIDGLIICDVNWKNEDKYRPDNCRAFKINQGIGTTKVIGFDWGTPSANGKMTPVAILEPIVLCGTTVKRVTCNNISFIEKMGIEIGKTVKVVKSGDIIPKILEVLD